MELSSNTISGGQKQTNENLIAVKMELDPITKYDYPHFVILGVHRNVE